jgi:hypothetical protein
MDEERARGSSNTVLIIVNSIPTKLVGSQKKFSSPPTPFETCG